MFSYILNRKKEKGLRLGYMGHLTHISDEICKLMSKCSNQFSDKINGKYILLFNNIYIYLTIKII